MGVGSEFIEGLIHTRSALFLARLAEKVTRQKEKKASLIVDQLINDLKSSSYFNGLDNNLRRDIFIRAIERYREEYHTLDFIPWESESSPEYQRAMTMLLGH
ncbi:MAG TPA: hypothetical protein DCX25_01115 [Candidatus Pacebacteria bacterium]|nr:MAG: hypothetical protein UX00_C0010G0010 [Microgenomates group bacterium GW2011_GWB1_45_17]KKU23572.1 MAG: hypothetical protein UX36_C0004G0025 [Microgenomates group bacterium GW2011_GWC1_46_15]KKU24291.1 MAG: hypothetical protein UX35_C0002G0025 [Microgenomates group bacterium GW2011_GWA1_46_15]HAV14909.1 hypothetical protein [Candidatus Paceibacterota bacterium]HCR11340.1 hypothetical protein [Candidatus Paceibacterota bacterium]